MNKPEITTEPIPDEEIETHPHYSKRFWYPTLHRSQWQLQDKEYHKLKEYLIDFYTTSPKDAFLYWAKDGTEAGDSPITLHYLNFVRSGCGCCGTMYEIPEFEGEILIEGKKYKYDGRIYGERWCETEDYGINERISDEKMSENMKSKYFLFKLDIIDGPFMFYHIYTELSNFCGLKYIENNTTTNSTCNM